MNKKDITENKFIWYADSCFLKDSKSGPIVLCAHNDKLFTTGKNRYLVPITKEMIITKLIQESPVLLHLLKHSLEYMQPHFDNDLSQTQLELEIKEVIERIES